MKLLYNVVVLVCMIGMFNFFELVVVVVILLFGLYSGVVFVIVVGVLVEVFVMFLLVWFVNKMCYWFD